MKTNESKIAVQAGFNFIGIEQDEEYMKIAKARIEFKNNPDA